MAKEQTKPERKAPGIRPIPGTPQVKITRDEKGKSATNAAQKPATP